MAGIRIMERDGTMVPHLVIGVDPDEVPVIFIAVKEGATSLVHPEYIADLLHQMDTGDLEPRQAWDHLLVKAPEMAYPQPCQVRRITGSGGAAEIVIDRRIVYRFT